MQQIFMKSCKERKMWPLVKKETINTGRLIDAPDVRTKAWKYIITCEELYGKIFEEKLDIITVGKFQQRYESW